MKSALKILFAATLLATACKKSSRDQFILSNVINLGSPDQFSYSPTGFGGHVPDRPFGGLGLTVATPFTGVGDYAIINFDANLSSSPQYEAGSVAAVPPKGTVTVTSFGPVGGYISGSFTVPTHCCGGDTSVADAYIVNGTFQLIRTQ